MRPTTSRIVEIIDGNVDEVMEQLAALPSEEAPLPPSPPPPPVVTRRKIDRRAILHAASSEGKKKKKKNVLRAITHTKSQRAEKSKTDASPSAPARKMKIDRTLLTGAARHVNMQFPEQRAELKKLLDSLKRQSVGMVKDLRTSGSRVEKPQTSVKWRARKAIATDVVEGQEEATPEGSRTPTKYPKKRKKSTKNND
jgi:hypothetical protein